jgi:hypothetical protein
LPSDQTYIINSLLPEVRDKMVSDELHYGDNHKVLGLKGQFADIWRKVGPLKRALWEDVELTRESPREICMDLIGHLLLTVAMIDAETRERTRRQEAEAVDIAMSRERMERGLGR